MIEMVILGSGLGPGKPVLDLPKIGFSGVPPENFERAHIDLKIAKMAILGGTTGRDLYFLGFWPIWVFLGLFWPFLAVFGPF